jgi:molecular chaperone GrpE (heat shock protein)
MNLKRIKGKEQIAKNADIQKLSAQAETNQRAETPVFFKLDRDFKVYCDYIDKYAIGLIEIKRELMQEQQLIRQRFEEAQAERDRAIRSNEKLMLMILSLSDDLNASNANRSEKSLTQVLESIERRLIDLLEKGGDATEIAVEVGKIYDPSTCEVVNRSIDNSLPQDTVVRVLSPGYVCGSRKLRNAKVEVSKKEEVAAKK